MKKTLLMVSSLLCILCLAGCNTKSMNYIIENKPSVTGIVKEVHESHIIMYSETAEGYPNGSTWSISLDVENTDSYTDIVVGDKIVVYHDGNIMETNPLQVGKVYAITLNTPADRAEKWDLIPMVMVNGELYLDTGIESSVEVRCGMIDGEITSTVDGSKKPTQNDQSNFGIGFGYQYGTESTIEIFMNEKWWIFATEEARQKLQFPNKNEESDVVIYNGKEYEKSELCNATLQWLELSEQERLLSSYLPPEFMTLENTLGITLTIEKITPTSATLKCVQSNGEPTGELHTGSWYILENWTPENGWKEMPYIIDGEIGWEDIAWIIPLNDTIEWEIDWGWLYGTMPAGKYRIGKEITDFRSAGDYDTEIVYAEFEIH